MQVNDPHLMRSYFARYYFGLQFNTAIRHALSGAADLYASYYVETFEGHHVYSTTGSGSYRWPDALWDLRTALGQQVVDRALEVGFEKVTANQQDDETSRDRATAQAITSGFSAILQDKNQFDLFTAITKRYGL